MRKGVRLVILRKSRRDTQKTTPSWVVITTLWEGYFGLDYIRWGLGLVGVTMEINARKMHLSTDSIPWVSDTATIRNAGEVGVAVEEVGVAIGISSADEIIAPSFRSSLSTPAGDILSFIRLSTIETPSTTDDVPPSTDTPSSTQRSESASPNRSMVYTRHPSLVTVKGTPVWVIRGPAYRNKQGSGRCRRERRCVGCRVRRFVGREGGILRACMRLCVCD